MVIFALLMPTTLWAQGLAGDETDEPYAVLSEGNTVLTFYYDEKKVERNGMDVGSFGSPNARGWHNDTESITTVVFDDSFANDTLLTSMYCWFYNCSNLTKIEGIGNLNTAMVTDMTGLFSGCTKLASVDLTGFNTSNVTIMYGMFQQCSSLTTLNVTGFNTAKVEDMRYMFSECSGLKSLDLSSFNVSNVTYMDELFAYCSALTTIYVGSEWLVDSEKTSGPHMFRNCEKLVGGKGTTYDSNHLHVDYAHIDGGTDNPGYFTDIADAVYRFRINVVGDGVVRDATGDTRYSADIPVKRGNSVELKFIPDDGWKFASFVVDDVDMTSEVTPATDDSPASYTYQNVTGIVNVLVTFVQQSMEPYAVLSEDNTVLTFYFDEKKAERNGMSVGPFNDETDRIWHNQRESITTVEFAPSFANCTTLTSTVYWFYGCRNLISISGIQYLNTDNVTSMHGMFCKCSGLTNLDVNGFNTANVTSMSSMFYGCSGLTSLDVSSFNTNNVWDMYCMFYGCSGLTSLDVSNFNTANVKTMEEMFSGCSSLTSLDLSGFNTAYVTDMSRMFSSCSDLSTIYAGSEWNTDVVTVSENMFEGCTKLIGGKGTTYDSLHIDNTYARIDGGPNSETPGYFTLSGEEPWTAPSEPEPYAVLSDNNTVLTFYYDEKKAERNGMSVGPFAQDQSEARGWNDNSETIVSAIIDDSFANYTELTSLAHWFSKCKNLETITGMNNLKTEKVTSMYYMFSGCEKLRSVDVSGLNTSNVRNMWGVFWYCSSLTELDLSNFDTSNAYTIGGMFESCSSLTSLDVSGFNIEKVSSIYEIFDGCKSLTDIKLFEFKNNDVDDLFAMFRNCSSLTTLDLTSFNTSNVKEMPAMFSGCTNLKTIYVGSEWSTAAVTNGESMFNNCTSLVGGAGTVYDENHIDYTYAHIDEGASNPGYFTDKNAPVINVTLNEYGVLSVNSDVTMAEALEEASKKHNVEKWITAIVWNSNKPIANSELQSLTNPNMLIFVPADSLAPQNRDNVVIGDLAKNIVLKDVTEGNGSFYSPKSFKAEMISYTHEYRQQTEIGVARGWETIALPFTVQTIMHEKQGRIVPFGISDSGANFWLRQMTSNGLQRATQIEANVPYIISMPNNEAYYAQNNLAGRVTFSSQDAMVPMTEYTAVHMQVEGGMLMFVPCFQATQTGNMIYALNVGEARGNHPEGSVFEANYRNIRPFEAYTVHEGNYGPAPQYIPIFDLNEAGFTGIEEVRSQMEEGRSDVWYDLNGRRLQSEPTQKGVYLHNGRKQVVK
jgi:surface protein